MDIIIATNNYAPYWDEFVQQSNNGTIFHTLKFLNYHPSQKFKRVNLVFKKSNKTLALLSGAIDSGTFFSPAGASYGSFVVDNIDLATYEEVLDRFIKFCKVKKIKKVILTPPPIIYQRNANEIERFLLSYKKFSNKVQLISNAVNISTLKKDKDILNSFTDMHRRAVLKSFKENIIIKVNNDYKNFYPMLLENKKKFNTKPTHTLEEMLTIKRLFPKNVFLIMAYTLDKKPIGGIWALKCNDKVGLAFYISHYYEYQNLRAVNRLFFELIKWGKKHKLEWIDLGVSMDTFSKNPMEPSRSLIFFKEGIGTRGFLRSTYTYNFR